jgi:hypothetical protein
VLSDTTKSITQNVNMLSVVMLNVVAPLYFIVATNIATLGKQIVLISVIMLSVILLNVMLSLVFAKCCHAEVHSNKCHCAECYFAECRNAEPRCDECCYGEGGYSKCHYAECQNVDYCHAHCRVAIVISSTKHCFKLLINDFTMSGSLPRITSFRRK